jgi:RHS repeat-associated protein
VNSSDGTEPTAYRWNNNRGIKAMKATDYLHLLPLRRGILIGSRLIAAVLILAIYLQPVTFSVQAKMSRAPVNASARINAKSEPLPVQTGQTVVVFGPRQVDRSGPVSRFSTQFTLPVDVTAPFNIQITNGDSNGEARVLTATVTLNGLVVVTPTGLNAGVSSVTKPVLLLASNTVDVSFFGRFNSHLLISFTATRVTNGSAPIITDFNPKQGPPGTLVTLSGTSLKVDNNNPSVTFAAANNARQQAQVVTASATAVNVTVPNGAQTGFIELTNANGVARTASAFTVQASQDFQLNVMPATVNAMQRSSSTQVVAVTSSQTDFSQLARLQVTGLPAGVNRTFDPDQITAGATSSLSLNLANVDLSPGSYPFTVSATATIDGHDVQHTFPATLNVIAAGQTALTGRVLSTEKDPIIGATVSLDGKTATTDSAGSFLLIAVTAGQSRPVMIDGSTASAPNKHYPVIVEPANILANQVNTVPFTFYLPSIDTQFEKDVIPNQNTVIDNPRVPDLAMTIPANANLKNRDGTPVTRASITPVPIDRTPAPLPANLATSMVYTSQPGGATSSVPIPVVYPNLAGNAPNTRVELYYFNHNLVVWQRYGFGRVSSDGRTVAPEIDPNTGKPYGLPDFSWHFFRVLLDNLFGGNPGDKKNNCGSKTGNPVDLSTGMKLETSTDISFGGARGTLELTRFYTSALANKCNGNCPFGRVSTFNYDVRLTGDFAVGGAGYLIQPDEVNGRLFQYNSARSSVLGLPTFTNGLTASQIGDEIRKLNDGTFEYRRRNGQVMRFDSNKKLVSMIDTNGNMLTLNYSGGNLTSVTDPVGRSIVFTYNGSREITSATDPLGRVWQYSYDSSGVLLTGVTDPLNSTTTYTYSLGSLLASIIDARGNTVKQITYDSQGHVVQQKFADGGVESYAYTLAGTAISSVSITDPLGRTETRRFNSAGYVIESTDALGQASHTDRDLTTNLPIAISGPCGCTEGSYEYDDRGNLTKSTDRLGNVRQMEFEPIFNKLTKLTDELGHITTYAYDAHGNMTSMTDALGRITSYAYDANGEITSITDPLGHVKQLAYDAQGNITSVKDALNDTTAFEYDAIGRLTAVVDPLGRRATFAYDSLDRITTLTDPAGAATTLGYDPNGNLTSFVNALNKRWNSVYDSTNRLVSTSDPLGRVMRRFYDKEDQLTSQVSPSGRTTRYAYDPRGLMTSMTTPLGFVTNYEYDNHKNLKTLTDARGNVTTFSYDELYRLAEQLDPLGHATHYTYDAASNVTGRVDRLGRSTTYTYDALNRPTRIQYADATVNYTYDPAYRLTHIDDTQSGAIDWAYDDADRLLSETTPQGVVSYTYNTASQRASMAAADRPPVNYTYDSAGRLKTIAQTSETFTYSYDTLSRVASLQRPNGVRTDYAYDNVYRLARLTHTNALNQALEDFQYSYNNDDEIESISSLASATLLPTAKTAVPADAANRLPQFGNASYTFDNEGQTTSRNDAPTVTNFTWDARGRLTRATLSNGQSVDYGYDAIGRRNSRTEEGATTTFLYDKDEVVRDQSSIGSKDDYLNGFGVDNKLRQATSLSSSHLYFLSDHLGSTSLLTDASGGVVERESAEAYGAGTASALTRYGYTGREQDTSTGLIYSRARWYDPKQARFLSEDPIGLRGGGNLYSYVSNNPISFKDPSGRTADDLAAYYRAIILALDLLLRSLNNHPPPPPDYFDPTTRYENPAPQEKQEPRDIGEDLPDPDQDRNDDKPKPPNSQPGGSCPADGKKKGKNDTPAAEPNNMSPMPGFPRRRIKAEDMNNAAAAASMILFFELLALAL